MFANTINSQPLWFTALKEFTQWLYQNSNDDSWVVRKARADFHQTTLEAGPEAYVRACSDFVCVFNQKAINDNPTLKSEFHEKYHAVHEKIKAHESIGEGLIDMDRAAKIWVDRAELERKKTSIYLAEAFVGGIAGAGLSAFLNIKFPLERADSSDSSEANTLDVALLVLYLFVGSVTPVLWAYYYKEINQIPALLSSCLTRQPIISSAPLFESAAWVLQVYVMVKFLEADKGVNPYNWLALALPPAALAAGNMVGNGVDRLRTLCQWQQTAAPERERLLHSNSALENADNTWCAKLYNCIPKFW